MLSEMRQPPKLEIQHLRENLACREAYTPYAAQDAVDYLIDAFRLRRDPRSRPGRVVFVYRNTEPAHPGGTQEPAGRQRYTALHKSAM